MTSLKRKRALKSLMFIEKRRDGRSKERTCANDSEQRHQINERDSLSLTSHLNAVLLTEVIDAEEHREVVTLNASNAFVLTEAKNLRADPDKRVIMAVKGALAEMPLLTSPNTCKNCVIHEKSVLTICS